jgi:hypothetical protein
MLKFRSLPGSLRLLNPTPETPEPEIVEDATESPPTAFTPAPPMPIFWPVAAFMITLLLADGGLLPIWIKRALKGEACVTYH